MQADETLLYCVLLNGINSPCLEDCPQLDKEIARVRKLPSHGGKRSWTPSEDEAPSVQDSPSKCIHAAAPPESSIQASIVGNVPHSPRTPRHSPSTVSGRLFSLPSPCHSTYSQSKQILLAPKFPWSMVHCTRALYQNPHPLSSPGPMIDVDDKLVICPHPGAQAGLK